MSDEFGCVATLTAMLVTAEVSKEVSDWLKELAPWNMPCHRGVATVGGECRERREAESAMRLSSVRMSARGTARVPKAARQGGVEGSW